DEYALDIENQSGSRLEASAEERRQLVLGLVLHDKAKGSMRRGDYATALQELLLAEEALTSSPTSSSSAGPSTSSSGPSTLASFLASTDNLPLLRLDLVWAAWQLRDLRRLAVCRERLAAVRQGLAAAHGPGGERLRNLTGGAVAAELATYLRLDVCEGLVAYYGGEGRAAAEACFRAAQEKWRRLQVSDESLALLQSMGYGLRESRRALRLSGGDVGAAVEFIAAQQRAEEERAARRKRLHDWNHERVLYGKTPVGQQYVDPEQLDRLGSLGFPRRLAAEALRKNENRGQDALDELSKPERRRALELEVALREGVMQATSSGSAAEAGTSTGGGEGALAAGSGTAAGGSG
ncbi:hypothetical protein Agub_g1512, partial [Astrephomene gubernaculifera]